MTSPQYGKSTLKREDPNATLELIRSIVRFTRGPSADMQTPAELLEDLVKAAARLDEWMSGGGRLPTAWATMGNILADAQRGPVTSTQYGEFTLKREGLDTFVAEQVTDTWDPVEIGEEAAIEDLVYQANQKGFILGPPDGEVSFEYNPDSDGGGFQYHVRLEREIDSRQRWLTLASLWHEMRNVVWTPPGEEDQPKGTQAATQILENAIEEANAALRDLQAFTGIDADTLTVIQEALGDAYAYRLGEGATFEDLDPEDREPIERYRALAQRIGITIN